jgi:DNA-binding response OmpR family regulator
MPTMTVSASRPLESPCALFIEPDRSLALLVRAILSQHSIDVLAAESPADAQDVWRAGRVQAIILDCDARAVNLRELLRLMEHDRLQVPVVVLSSFPPDIEEQLADARIHSFVRKPFDNDAFALLIRSLTEAPRPLIV